MTINGQIGLVTLINEGFVITILLFAILEFI